MKKLSRKEVAKLGLYDFLGYIDAFDSPYIGGLAGTRRLIGPSPEQDRATWIKRV